MKQFPKWIYHPTKEPKIVQNRKEIPRGWRDSPAKCKKSKK